MKSIKITDTINSVYFELTSQSQIGKLEGWEYPSVVPVIEEISGPQSAIYITSKYGPRRFSLTGYQSEMSKSQRRSMLQALRQNGTIKLLEFTTLDDLALRAEVEVVKVLSDYNFTNKPFLIDLIAPDWRFYGQTLNENDSADAEQIITNSGNEITDPVFKIYGPFATATITNLANSYAFDITGAVADGHYLEVDMLNRTVELDGLTSAFDDFDGDFFGLEPGANTLQFSYTTGGANTNLITNWRHAYNGV